MENITPDKNLSRQNPDLPDSKEDQEKLKQEVVIIDMPEVQDIPGQEHVRVPDLREMQDVTISSADEEAEELLREINTGPAGGNDRDDNEQVAQDKEKSTRNDEAPDENSRY